MSADSFLDCPKQTRCAGCPLGAEPYEQGLAKKGSGLGAALSPYTELTPELLPPRAAAPTFEYRLRAKLVSRGRSLGLYERGTHRVLDIDGCKVLSRQLTHTSAALRRLLPLPIYGADLRETADGALVTLLTEDPSAKSALEEAARALVERGGALSVAISLRREGDVRLLAGEPQVVTGPSAARHALTEGAPYGYAAHGGFVQAHGAQASYVYAEIVRGLAGISEAPAVLELFAGNGTLALALAKAGAHVTAVESYAPAITLAERAAREQGLSLRAVASDATRFIRDNAARFDAVIVNPPRRGLSPELRAALGRTAPQLLAYVSCNPHSLARDAAHLQRLGLRLERAEPLDMIPWSDAIEALAWFRRAPAPAPRVLFEDARCLAVEKHAHETLSELSRKISDILGYADAVALEAWGPGVSGVCWFSKSGAKPSDLVRSAERELLLLARGNLRKQGTVTRLTNSERSPGARYKKQADVGRHSLLTAFSHEPDEGSVLADFASISHPILGDATHGDSGSNQFMEHRHGLDRLFLHVARSSLRLADDSRVEARSELAPELERVISSLGSD